MWIASIGYEKASFADFLRTLEEAKIAAIIDVRDLPQSRRAGFSRRQLEAGLVEAGLRYVHLKALGTPKEGRVAARSGQTARFWAIVAATLATDAAATALAEAAAIAREQRSALLCYEADPRQCHRSRVCDLLAERFGFSATHLQVRDVW